MHRNCWKGKRKKAMKSNRSISGSGKSERKYIFIPEKRKRMSINIETMNWMYLIQFIRIQCVKPLKTHGENWTPPRIPLISRLSEVIVSLCMYFKASHTLTHTTIHFGLIQFHIECCTNIEAIFLTIHRKLKIGLVVNCS